MLHTRILITGALSILVGLIDVAMGAHREAGIFLMVGLLLVVLANVARWKTTMDCPMCATRIKRDVVKCYQCGHITGRLIRPANEQV